jgi:hypothetical protein
MAATNAQNITQSCFLLPHNFLVNHNVSFFDILPFSEVTYAQYKRLPPSSTEHSDETFLCPDTDLTRSVQYKRRSPKSKVIQLIRFILKLRLLQIFPGSVYYKRNGKATDSQNVSYAVMTDQHVVSYNPFLVLKYGTHCNVEYVFGQKACKYIFKYILKGSLLSGFILIYPFFRL